MSAEVFEEAGGLPDSYKRRNVNGLLITSLLSLSLSLSLSKKGKHLVVSEMGRWGEMGGGERERGERKR